MSWMLTRSGKAFDLVHPIAASVDIETDVAIGLSHAKRFTGHAGDPALGYSVAQHCALGADAMLDETRDPAAALAFLLHDAHEAYMGDIGTPTARALDEIANQIISEMPTIGVRLAVGVMKKRLDAAIYARLGLAWPLSERIEALVHDMDARMLRAEITELMPQSPRALDKSILEARPILTLPALTCWPAPEAAGTWLGMLDGLLAEVRKL